MDKEKTQVIFRKFIDHGDIIALFPNIQYYHYSSDTVMSYQHIGQHGGADLSIMDDITTLPASLSESKPLFDELTSLGYNLDVQTV